MNRTLITATLLLNFLLPATAFAGPTDGFRTTNGACPAELPALTTSILSRMVTCRGDSGCALVVAHGLSCEPGRPPVTRPRCAPVDPALRPKSAGLPSPKWWTSASNNA